MSAGHSWWMPAGRRALALFRMLAALLALLAFVAAPATGSHFAYGTISWVLVQPSSGSTSTAPTYKVKFQGAYRRSWWSPLPNAGDTLGPGSLDNIDVTYYLSDCCGKRSKDACWKTVPKPQCLTDTYTLVMTLLVTNVYVDDWLTLETTDIPAMSFTPTNNLQDIRLEYRMNARISTLVYGNDIDAQVTGRITAGHFFSPQSTAFPRQYFVLGSPVSWSVPSIHLSGLPMTYGLTSPAEASLPYSSPPSPKYGSVFTLDSSTGAVTWTPNTVGLFSIQFSIYARDPSIPTKAAYPATSSSSGQSLTTLDLIFSVIKGCAMSDTKCAHLPVFDPEPPPTAIFYRGSGARMTVTVRVDDAASVSGAVEITTTTLPFGSSFNYVGVVTGKNTLGKACSWTTYQLTWSPTIASVPVTLCFNARTAKTAMPSAGSHCTNLLFGTADTLYISGILRDFHKVPPTGYSTFKDFNIADGDSNRLFVNTDLTNSLPDFDPSAGAVTTSANNFPMWFTSDPSYVYNKPQIYDILLNNGQTNRKNVFSWNPGAAWWPIENQVFGNEDDAHNRFFTLEIHTYITYMGGEILTFQASDDLFVFIDKQLVPNWDMGGVLSSQLRQHIVYMDKLKNPATDTNQTFQMDIFYAHRSATGDPRIQLQIMSATLCNALATGTTLVRLNNTFTPSNVKLIGSSQITTGALQLMVAGPSKVSSAWLANSGTSATYKILHGFSAKFEFRWSGLTEGFAFLLHFDNPLAQGGSSSQLGYGGAAGIQNSIAVEFDGVQNTATGDPNYQHVSIHSRWTAANDANENYRATGSLDSDRVFNFRFDNGTWYNVNIEYTPAIDDGTTGPQYGWIRVYMGQANGIQQAGPIVSAQVDGRVLETMWHGAAYVGFTAATSDAAMANIFIRSFKLTVVPPSATNSIALTLPTPITAGQCGSFRVQLKDFCGNTIINGGDCAAMTGKLWLDGVLLKTLSCGDSIADNSDGTYTISYCPTVVSTPETPYTIQVFYTDTTSGLGTLPVSGSPFPFQVRPAASSASKSSFTLSFTNPTPEGNPRAGAIDSPKASIGTVTITARDAYGNLQTVNTDTFTIAFSPDITTSGGVLNAPAKLLTPDATYEGSFQTPQSQQFIMSVQLGGSDLPGSPMTILFVAGAADAVQSSATGITATTAGQKGTFTVQLRDSAGNVIQTRNSEDSTCLTEADGCALKPLPVSSVPNYNDGILIGRPTPVSVPITCVWFGALLSCSYTVTVAFNYYANFVINGVSMPTLLAATFAVSPSDLDATKCVAVMPSDAVAGSVKNLQIQLRDQFSNNRLTTTGGAPPVVAFTPGLTLTPSLVPTYTSLGQYLLSFVPDKAGRNYYSVSVSLDPTSISGSPYTLSVSPGTPDRNSKLSGVVTNPIIASASFSSPFQIQSIDAYDNVRTQGGNGTDYLVTLTSTSIPFQVYDAVSFIPNPSNEIYQAYWGSRVAGEFTLKVKVRTQSAEIQGSSVKVTVNPAPTSTPHCTVTGDGIVGGFIGDYVKLTVTAQDEFDNVQLASVTDKFRVIVTGYDGDETVTPATPTGPNYAFTYKVPTPLDAARYTIAVQREDPLAPGTWGDLVGSPFTAVAVQAGNLLYVTLENVGTGVMNQANQFNVIERNGLNGDVKTGGMLMAAKIESEERNNDGSGPAITIPMVSVSAGTVSSYNFTVTYTPKFTFPKSSAYPNGNPNFLITISRGTTTSQAGTGINSWITASPYKLLLRAGQVYGPASSVTGLPGEQVAGEPGTIHAQLFDMFYNAIDYELPTGSVKATLSPLIAIAGLQTYTFNGVADSNDPGSYTFTYNNMAAGVYKVVLTVGAQVLGTAEYISQVTIKPAPPAAAKSKVTVDWIDAIGLIAGAAGTSNKFTLTARDSLGNYVDPANLENNDITPYLSFALDDGASGDMQAVFGKPTYRGSQGAFEVSLTAYKVGAAIPLRVNISGEPLPTSTSILVRSAAINPSKSSLQNIPAQVEAGTDISFVLAAFDLYGNPYSSGIVAASARALDALGRQVPIVVDVTASANVANDGLYTFKVAAAATTVAGSYTFEIRADGTLLEGASLRPTILVVAGPAVGSKTDTPSYLPPAYAGEVTAFNITLHDRFGNPVLYPTKATLDSIIVNFPIDKGEFECGMNPDSDIDYGDDHFQALAVTPASPGVIQISFRGELVNRFKVNITIGNVPSDCTRLSRLSLTVLPGLPLASASTITGLRSIVAGEGLVLEIRIRDKFRNMVELRGAKVELGGNFLDAVPFSPVITRDSTTWLRKNNSAIIDQGKGVYTVTVNPTTAGTRQVVVTLDGYLIPTFATDFLTPVTPTVIVSPNVPTRYQIVSAPSELRAAVPFVYTLQALDYYSNPINQLNADYDYTYTISAQSTTQTDYRFKGTLTYNTASGHFSWTATSALAGKIAVYIEIVQRANLACASVNPAKPVRCTDLTCSATRCAQDAGISQGTAEATVVGATCASIDAKTPYRCPDADADNGVSRCVAAYTDCPSLTAWASLPTGTQVQCAVDGSWVASAFDCPCPGAQTRCASGTCVDNASTQCHPIQSCPADQVACTNAKKEPTGECRLSKEDCPSPAVCTPGFVACADGISCKRTLAECQAATVLDPAVCPAFTFRCPNGRCTASVTDCATPVTCPSGQVLCLADGSCKSSALLCPDQYKCYAPTPFTCQDGSCRADASGCPSDVTCPSGWVMCANGQCASSFSTCLPATTCPLDLVRCPSGECVTNLMLCSSQVTCPSVSAPVLCPDHTCAESLAFCVKPRVCPTTTKVCPDGSCVALTAICPTGTSCPAATPILCADGTTCTSDASQCIAPTACPVTVPMRCPDGSCRGALTDCPSRSSCPASLPVRCADGSCVFSSQQCSAIPSCSADSPIRCPGGECVKASSLCPTHVTCPIGAQRCADGSCRVDCTGAQAISCAAGLFSCPLPSAGSYCVSNLSQCPPSFICPDTMPVRCLDSTCATSVALCPALPSTPPETSKYPCPDGSWVSDLSGCNTPASCPAATPYKCADETCRAVPTDCVTPTVCTSTAAPYRCPNGGCSASPYASDCRVTVATMGCSASAPVKCPGTTKCVTDVSLCTTPSLPKDPANPTSPTDPVPVLLNGCPPDWGRCRDGSCRMSNKTCDAVSCPASLPYLCATGICAANAAGCPNPLTGCYAPAFGCASTGGCVTAEADCPTPGEACALKCADGFCVSITQVSRYAAICSTHKCTLRCADGSCGLTATVANITAATPGNLCTQAGTPNPATAPLKNVCPSYLPYKCDSGLCAVSSLNCTAPNVFGNCPPDRPVQCANAACVRDTSQCPPLYPCASNEMRCGDGSCRTRYPDIDPVNAVIVDSETATCKAWGISNLCPIWKGDDPKATKPAFRCPNGMCAPGTTAAACQSTLTGCPNGYLTKCPNGACIPTVRYSGLNNSIDACAAVMPSQADGCPLGTSKCAYGGQCVANTATDCPRANGCLPATPYRCTVAPNDSGECVKDMVSCTPPVNCNFRCADGSCADDATKCRALNGCPIATPFRCANGACAQFGTSALLRGATLSQVCPPTVVCASGSVLCYDGSCAATSALCPSVAACLTPNVLCADRTCKASASLCPTGVANDPSTVTGSTASGLVALAGCPTSVPVLCDNGQCVARLALCPSVSSPGSGTGTGVGSTITSVNAQNAAAASSGTTTSIDHAGVAVLPVVGGTCAALPNTPVECFDGSCVKSLSDCITRGIEYLGAGATGCPDAQVMCPTGECVPDPTRTHAGVSACRVIPGCRVGQTRCANGACVDNPASCGNPLSACGVVKFPGYFAVETQRCQDGQCRYQCPAYEGCPHTTAPYQCANRECAANEAACENAAFPDGFIFSSVRPFLLAPLRAESKVSSSRRLFFADGVTLVARSHAPFTTRAVSFAQSTGAMHWCYANCASQLKAQSYTTMVDINLNQKLTIASDATNVEFASLAISAGSLQVQTTPTTPNSTTPTTPTRVAITIAPVSDGTVRAAENRVASSRADVAPSGYLTAAQTVLSPMFEITIGDALDPTVQLTVLTNFVITATIDMVRAPIIYEDICLAKLSEIPEIGYSSWQCVTSCNGQRCPVRGSTSAGPASQVTGSIGVSGKYAFIEVPVAEPVQPTGLSWLQANAIWVFLVLAGAFVILLGLFYVAGRFRRYRRKLHDQRKVVKENADELADIEQFGAGAGGRRDDEVVTVANPLVTQMADMQARYDEKALKQREEEAKAKEEEHMRRHTYIAQLQADRNELAEEVTRMRRDLSSQGGSRRSIGAPTPMSVMLLPSASPMSLVPLPSPSGSPTSTVEAHASHPDAIDLGELAIQLTQAGVIPEPTADETREPARTVFQMVRTNKRPELE